MTWILVWYLAQTFLPLGGYILPISMVLVMGVYLYQGIYKKHLFTAVKSNAILMAFILQGGIWCILSFCGLAGWFDLTREFGVNMSYLPRQAYYFYFIPLFAFVPFFKADNGMDFVKEHRHDIMIAFYILTIILSGSAELTISNILMLCFLSLLCDGKVKAKDWVFMVAIMLLPMSEYGTSTIIILKVIYVGLFVVYNKLQYKKLVAVLASFTIPVILLGSFAVPQIPHICDKIADVNARWRLEYWLDSATAIVDSKGVGIGYGTTYASTTFAKGNEPSQYTQTCETCGNVTEVGVGPFDANGDYSVEQRAYVTATHNSFVSIALRMGVLGLALFCGMLFTIWRRLTKSKCSDMGAMMFLFCGALFMISLNVGLESPGYFGVFMVSMCIIIASARGNGQAHD